jgi:non-specific serine/threonine protein kinase
VVDESTAQLRVDGTEVDLDRSSYDVLLALLRHAGEIVTKDELLESGWPGRVVSENSLAKAISRLRQALAEGGEAIRVVHGYGYRLAAPVQLQPSSAPVLVHPGEAMRLREGDPVPHRSGWRIDRRLGAGSSGVTFLAHSQAGETRVFKFAQGEAGVHGLKREIALTRYVRAVRADLPGVALVLDWNLRQPPFFVELPYFADGHLADWAAARGGLPQLDAAMRVELCASLCETVAGLHEIGVIHKDLKPENLYPQVDADGRCSMVLSDLGAGEAALSPRLAELGLTLTLLAGAGERAGSLMYLAPEVIAGEEPTVRSDVFALGVLLYQLVVGNLRRPLAPGWENDVEDPLLREDIALAAASNPERRQVDAHVMAERLRTLDARRAQRDREERERAMAEQRESVLLRERARRRLWLTAAVASGIGLVGALGMSVYAEKSRRVAVAEAARADREATKARGVADFLVHDLLGQADVDAAQARLPATLRQAIDRAAPTVDARFAGDPDVAAAIHAALGSAYQTMALWSEGAAEYARQVHALEAARPRDPAAIAKARGDACRALVWAGDYARSEPSCERARRELVATGLSTDALDAMLANVDTRFMRNRRAVARLEPLVQRLHGANGDPDLLSDALWSLGYAYGKLGRLQDQERAYRQSLQALQGQANWRRSSVLAEYGLVLLKNGKTAEGMASLREAKRITERTVGTDHSNIQSADLVLAQYEAATGDWAAVRPRADRVYRALLPQIGWEGRTVHAAMLAMTAHARTGDAAAARAIMAAFDEELAKAADKGHEVSPYLREARWQAYAATHVALGEFPQAERYLARLRDLAASAEVGPLAQAHVDCLQAELSAARGDTAAALARARSCRKRTLDATSPDSPLLQAPDRLLASLGGTP